MLERRRVKAIIADISGKADRVKNVSVKLFGELDFSPALIFLTFKDKKNV